MDLFAKYYSSNHIDGKLDYNMYIYNGENIVNEFEQMVNEFIELTRYTDKNTDTISNEYIYIIKYFREAELYFMYGRNTNMFNIPHEFEKILILENKLSDIYDNILFSYTY